MLKAPVAIHAAIVINEHGGIETIDTHNLIRIVRVPVAHLEGAVRAIALSDEGVTSTCLVVGEEPVGFLTRAVGGEGNIRGEQYISRTGGVERLTLGILADFEDDTVVAPLAQIFYGSRPYYLIATTIHGLQVVV